eukprot:scaffold5613_cov69-Phaeocystis_antarctica.AAC.2
MLAPRFSSSLTISRLLVSAAACSRPKVEVRPSSFGIEQSASTDPPLPSHVTTFCSLPRSADSKISRGSEAGELTAGSPASGGAAGEAAAGCGGAACCRMRFAVAGWPWSSAHCRAVRPPLLSSSVSGLHQGGPTITVLQVNVGRVLQQDEQDGVAAVVRSIHERGLAEAALQVDARASLQQHLRHLQVVVGCGGVQQGVEQSASTGPPLRNHLTTFCSSPRSADRKISSGSGAGELIAARRRSTPPAILTRVASPASEQPLVCRPPRRRDAHLVDRDRSLGC